MSLGLGNPVDPDPRFATVRNESRETIGGDIAKVLARAGKKVILPMPWQRTVLDVAGEIDPATGLYWYRTVIIIVPRQSGKTTMTRGKLTHRALTDPGANLLYTAQDRNKARQRLEETIYKELAQSSLKKTLGKPRWAAGSEAVRFLNGSTLRIEALGLTSGHGDTLAEAHIDEAFAHRDNRIEQNVSPTMITVQGAQKWITSAAGGHESAFLRQKVDMGRAIALSGKDSRTAYFEWSAALDADPDDPVTYLSSHPAIGHTTTLEIIQDERDSMDSEEFERAYLGWWPKVAQAKTVIPLESWRNNFTSPEYETWIGTPIWSVDVSPDREWASIGLAAKSYDPAARAFLEVIDHEQGTQWIIPRLTDLRTRFGGRKVALDGSGGAASLEDDLKAAGFDVIRLTANDKAAACGALYDDVIQEKLRFLDDPVLNSAMRSAAKVRAYGGESWIFSRGKSLADITPLYAAILARFAFVREAPYDALDSIA